MQKYIVLEILNKENEVKCVSTNIKSIYILNNKCTHRLHISKLQQTLQTTTTNLFISANVYTVQISSGG